MIISFNKFSNYDDDDSIRVYDLFKVDHMLLLNITRMKMKIKDICDFILFLKIVFLEMLLSCYCIVLVLFS